jgi:hypothetical protein
MSFVDGGGVDGVPPEDAEAPNPFGVTVQDVRNLVTHLAPDPAFSDPDFGPSRGQITDQMVSHWIRLVADSVATRAAMLARFESDADKWAVIMGAARTAVTNGAASYLVSAAFPGMAGTSDQTSYSAELWRRYEADLGTLVDLGTILDQAGGPGGSTEGIMPVGSRNRPSVRDGSGFFATDPVDPFYVDPNRMHPRVPGYYPAPGSEGYRY